ncbi:unnamed protein product [Notodromas monacha]|uniref:Headcase middle domain-containing protein n=1 Tax=Notodromas monacha TaxID=399045 RepID=A0A7R9BVX5_9CRUS|nr:unnamed protein product [Notodromas monacha]CAG0921223.1 unnamed protein product [Notodromas monacha]
MYCLLASGCGPDSSGFIDIDDDGQNDDIRPFILNRLLALKISRVSCCLCNTWMTVFDRCPLIDGTFFLSPRQHSKQCIEVKYENRAEYLNSVCMGCLEGWGSPLKCRGCNKPWDGSDLVLGSMYAFDIFATVPCCAERLKK